MAPAATTPDSKKRGRPRDDIESGHDQVSAKKPRLNSSAAKRTTPSSLRSLSSAISGAFGLGSRKVSTNGAVKQGKEPIDKTWEIPDSDGEEATRDKSSQPNRSQPRTANAKPVLKNALGDGDAVYKFQAPDEDPTPAQTPSRTARGHASSTTTRASATSKSTSNTTRRASKPQSQATGLKSSGRSVAAKNNPADEQKHEDNTQVSSSEDELTPVAVRSVNKLRGSTAQTDTNSGTPKLKGILTPSRRLSERNPKSVAFGEIETRKTDEVYFADLPSKVNKTKPTPPRTRPSSDKENDEPAEGPNTPEDDDDEVCVICSKPDSKPPNEILFCDSCNMAVHQKCYGVARIPKGDWLCKGCSQDLSSTIGAMEKKAVMVAEKIPDIPKFEQHLRALQRVLLDRCTGRRRIPLRDQEEAYDKTFQLVEQTVLSGEGNSMLVIGARGCGKTTVSTWRIYSLRGRTHTNARVQMVDSVLSDLSREHKNEFHVVRLNGFIHTDDKLALKDIWRQLGKEMEVEDDLIRKTNNYADTLASLLALLSHPSEITETHEGITSKSVVFIIDEFDLFATHARQTLLYNLFDIAQSRKAPIAVLGLTNRIDVVESLEKRVKSRFSHRYAYLSLAKSLPAYWDICKQGFLVADEDAQAEGLNVSLTGFTKFQDYWTKKIETLYEDAAFKEQLEYHYYHSKSVPAFFRSCVLPLSDLSSTSLSLRFSPAPGAVLATDPPDSKLHLLEALSDLDLSLLISAARLDIVAHTDTVNFAMAYDEYTALIGRQRVQSATSGMLALGGGVRVWGRGVAEMSWERLVSLGLLLPTGLGGRHGGLEGKMWKVDVTLEEIPIAVKLNAILARWCREI